MDVGFMGKEVGVGHSTFEGVVKKWSATFATTPGLLPRSVIHPSVRMW